MEYRNITKILQYAFKQNHLTKPNQTKQKKQKNKLSKRYNNINYLNTFPEQKQHDSINTTLNQVENIFIRELS